MSIEKAQLPKLFIDPSRDVAGCQCGAVEVSGIEFQKMTLKERNDFGQRIKACEICEEQRVRAH